MEVHIKSENGEYGPVEDAHLIINHVLAHWFQKINLSKILIISHKGKNVLITGGTKGIGLAIARAFHNSEASLIITGTKKT